MRQPILFVLTGIITGSCFATPGVVNKSGCHRDKNNNYHCHDTHFNDSEFNANNSHLLIGFAAKNDAWYYDNGPMNLFSGIAGEVEYAYEHVAFHAGYGVQKHMTGDDDYKLSGWDIGAKGGPNISQIGLHPYAEVGYFNQIIEFPFNVEFEISGFQYGAGLIWNRPNFSIDFRLLNKTSSDLEQLWKDMDAPGLTYNLSAQVGLYFRFPDFTLD